MSKAELTPEQQEKLLAARAKKQRPEVPVSVAIFDNKQLEGLHTKMDLALEAVREVLAAKSEEVPIANDQLVELNNKFVGLIAYFEAHNKLLTEQPENHDAENIIRSIEELATKIVIPEPAEIPVWLQSPKIVESLSKEVGSIAVALKALPSKFTFSQKAEDYIPFRRVRKVGNVFQFDDQPWSAPGGGGGGGGSQSNGLTDAQLRASPVPVDVSDTSFATSVPDGADVALGSTTDAASATTVIGRLQKLVSLLPTSLGQKAKAASLPVVIASDQDALATSVPDGSDVALGATGDASSANTVIGRLKNLLSRWPAALGQTTKSGSVPVTLASDQEISPGSAATNLGKLDGATFADGDLGVLELAIRNTAQTTYSASSGLYTPKSVDGAGNAMTVGNIAHDGVDAGNPIKIGLRAKSTLTGLTLVAADDRTDLFSDVDGVQLTRDNAPLADILSGTASNTDGTSTQVLAAGAAGIKHYITDVTLFNSSASTIYVELKDGTTVRWVFPVPAGGGVTHSFKTPLVGSAATAWNFDPSAAATTIYCSVSAFKSKV